MRHLQQQQNMWLNIRPKVPTYQFMARLSREHLKPHHFLMRLATIEKAADCVILKSKVERIGLTKRVIRNSQSFGPSWIFGRTKPTRLALSQAHPNWLG